MNKTELKARRESIRWAYRELEQPATIIVLAERYLKQDPLDGVVWAWYGHTLMEMGRYAEADAALKTARGLVTTDDQKAFALQCRGDLEDAQGRVVEAEGLYREAVALVPDNQYAHVKLGRVLFKQGRLAEAESCFRHASQLEGDRTGAALCELGHTLRARESFFEARRVLKDALKLVPDSEWARLALADVERAMRSVAER